MNPEIQTILDTMKKLLSNSPPHAVSDKHTHLLVHASHLQVLLAEDAEKSTKKITRLTWSLFGLTVALLVVAIVQTIILK